MKSIKEFCENIVEFSSKLYIHKCSLDNIVLQFIIQIDKIIAVSADANDKIPMRLGVNAGILQRFLIHAVDLHFDAAAMDKSTDNVNKCLLFEGREKTFAEFQVDHHASEKRGLIPSCEGADQRRRPMGIPPLYGAAPVGE